MALDGAAGTVGTPSDGRDRNGRFAPGHKHARGRPRSGLALAERIRRRVDLDEIVDIAMDIARGRAIPAERDGVKTGDWIIPKTSDRVTALNWLAERGFVKPPTTIALEQSDAKPPIDFSRLDDAQLDQYERLLAIAAGETSVIDVVTDDQNPGH